MHTLNCSKKKNFANLRNMMCMLPCACHKIVNRWVASMFTMTTIHALCYFSCIVHRTSYLCMHLGCFWMTGLLPHPYCRYKPSLVRNWDWVVWGCIESILFLFVRLCTYDVNFILLRSLCCIENRVCADALMY